jgi:hypothetical protein
VQAYASLRRPFTVNDLFAQHLLQDRIGVYRTLVANAIPVPQHIIVEREGLEPGDWEASHKLMRKQAL